MRQTLLRGVPALLLISGVLFAAPSAEAVTFDFGQRAVDNGEQGFLNAAPFTWTISGLTVTATAFGSDKVYLDGPVGNPARQAGMGVCTTLIALAQCSPSSDDNVTSGETLRLVFSTAVTLDSVVFRDADHFLAGPGSDFDASDRIDVRVGGVGAFTTYDFSTGAFPLPALQGATFDFAYKNQQFYIATLSATSVPEPTTLGLMGMGLLAMVGIRRRRS